MKNDETYLEGLRGLSPKEVRGMIRAGKWEGPTAGLCEGYAQANLVALPKEYALDFMIFCQRNPKACPVLDVTEPGKVEPALMAPGADVSTDIPRYRVYENGGLAKEVTDASPFWREDLVAFLLGCSFSFEWALIEQGIPIRHIEENVNVSMYITNIPCKPAGPFKGPMVVSMRPIPHHMVSKAVLCTGRFPSVHGSPVHIGDPLAIGIKDLAKPDFGDPVTIKDGEVPVFWPCGVTPQAVAMASGIPFMISHSPGHMFICDVKNSELAVF
jgi:uncharacterized protein YcsI (UPF0317 family)